MLAVPIPWEFQHDIFNSVSFEGNCPHQTIEKIVVDPVESPGGGGTRFSFHYSAQVIGRKVVEHRPHVLAVLFIFCDELNSKVIENVVARTFDLCALFNGSGSEFKSHDQPLSIDEMSGVQSAPDFRAP